MGKILMEMSEISKGALFIFCLVEFPWFALIETKLRQGHVLVT